MIIFTDWGVCIITNCQARCFSGLFHDWLTKLAIIYLFISVYGHRISESSRSERVNNGDRLVLNCSDRNLDQFQGNMNFTWKKNSVTIPNDDPRLNADGKGTLLLEHVRQRDSGQYTCTFGTADVFSISNMTLFVIGRWLISSVVHHSSLSLDVKSIYLKNT